MRVQSPGSRVEMAPGGNFGGPGDQCELREAILEVRGNDFGAPGNDFGGPGDHFVAPGAHFGAPGGHFGGPGGHFGAPGGHCGAPGGHFEGPESRGSEAQNLDFANIFNEK